MFLFLRSFVRSASFFYLVTIMKFLQKTADTHYLNKRRKGSLTFHVLKTFSFNLQEVIQQLQLMGEVVYLKTEAADLICLCPKWLCSTLCGYLLSR
jgi:hypothetical protein